MSRASATAHGRAPSMRWASEACPLATRVCILRRVIHGFRQDTRQVVTTAIRRVQVSLEPDRLPRPQPEVLQHPIVANVGVVDARLGRMARAVRKHPGVARWCRLLA